MWRDTSTTPATYRAECNVANGVDYGTPDDPNGIIQAAITAADGGLVYIKKATYPDMHLVIETPANLVAETGTIFQSAANDFAVTIGDGVARVADGTMLRNIHFQPSAASAYGGVKLDGPVVDAMLDHCLFSHFEDNTHYAVEQWGSWESIYRRCRFWDTQHDLLLDDGGYCYTDRCYFNANDYGAHATVYNYGVYAKSGYIHDRHSAFETNNTTGVAFRSDFPGNNAFYGTKWEGGGNLIAIWRTANCNYPDILYCRRPADPIIGADYYPGVKIVDGKTTIPMSPVTTTDDDDGGTATITKWSGGFQLTTQNVTAQHASMAWHWANVPGGGIGDPINTIFKKRPEFDLHFRLSSVADCTTYLAWGDDADTVTNKHFGVKIVDDTLYLTCGNGTDGSTLTTGETLAATTWYHLNVESTLAAAALTLRAMLSGNSLNVTKNTYVPQWETLNNDLFFAKVVTGADAAKSVNATYPILRYA